MYESLLTGLYTAERMRAMDKAAIEGAGIPGGHLMERAGVGVTREILDRFDPEFVIVYAGKGNNGGDGFVVARELTNAGVDVLVVAVAGRAGYAGDALLNLQILDRLQFTVLDGLPPEGDERLDLMDCDLVVDAIFGTGFSGAAHGPAAEAIELINATPSPVVSIDIASGVDASSGEVAGPAVSADLTVTMHAAKVGHFVTPGGSLSGDVSIVPIGIPAGTETEADVWLLDLPGLTPILRPKGALDHKRSVGTVLVVGGSRGMGGAAFLAAMGALRSGAGLVHVALPASAAAGKPFVEVITTTLPDEQFVGQASLAVLREEMGRFKAIAMGPGLGREEATVQAVRELVKVPVPLLLDADGLWALGEDLALLKDRGAPAVLTPHEGELGRLLGRPAADVAAHRLACAREAAEVAGATVLLKGEASIVADPSGAAYIIPTGNPGLATPGTGDVLSGVIVAQLAKGLSATDAACLGGYLHGLAADLAAELKVGTEGMIAGDLLEFLPPAVERIKAGLEEHDHEHGHEE
jgi:ADP-dependent NAD(P)H-hydrate dehydratase / NAD(P)H-hydrate epimerase